MKLVERRISVDKRRPDDDAGYINAWSAMSPDGARALWVGNGLPSSLIDLASGKAQTLTYEAKDPSDSRGLHVVDLASGAVKRVQTRDAATAGVVEPATWGSATSVTVHGARSRPTRRSSSPARRTA